MKNARSHTLQSVCAYNNIGLGLKCFEVDCSCCRPMFVFVTLLSSASSCLQSGSVAEVFCHAMAYCRKKVPRNAVHQTATSSMAWSSAMLHKITSLCVHVPTVANNSNAMHSSTWMVALRFRRITCMHALPSKSRATLKKNHDALLLPSSKEYHV